ncbi:MAG: Seryl-tRNA synthetase, partial [Firmicutes bacterium]|nr:Seryl-tRNA synthetase [Bacillota bacterium]
MLDAKMIRANHEKVEQAMRSRNMPGALDNFLRLDEERRKLLTQVEAEKSYRNKASPEVGELKKKGQNADELMEKVRVVSQVIKD